LWCLLSWNTLTATAQYDVAQFNAKINAVQKQIGLKKKAKGDASDLLKEKTALEDQKKARETEAIALHTELQVTLKSVGNYVADTVPVSDTEDDNRLDRTWAPEGFDKTKQATLSHHEVLSRLDGYDPVRGVKLAGHRGYCLTNYGVLLNQALINYGLDFLHGKGSTLVQPPYFLNKQMMAKTAQLSQFDEELYHVSEGAKGETDSYLIATSEQPLSAMFSGEWLTNSAYNLELTKLISADDLPKRLGGYSTCFRKEAGSGGRDTWGIFRIHQFEKAGLLEITNDADDRRWSNLCCASQRTLGNM
jgi:seryl-tRNA synthetase